MKLLTTITIVISLCSTSAIAADSVNHASKASKHSVLAGSHAAVSTAKIASAVVAIPLVVAGSTGVASVNAGKGLMTSAVGGDPLPITDKTITADPSPQLAMETTLKEGQ